jgi:prepilin-type N-terminal cleavage/methylation domain-containing protein
MKNKFKIKKGFSLVEILVAVFITSLIIAAVGAFQRDVFYLNDVIQSGLTSQNDARKIIRPMVDEVRSASESSLGSYPLAITASSTFAFYSDIDNDSLKERVRYFLDNGDFKKGVIKPSGNPLTYNSSNEKIIEVVHDVINTDIFTYFNSSYDGTSSSTPIAQPVSPAVVRLVKIELIVDKDPKRSPAPITVGTQMSIRNLKDNYED